LIGLVWWQEPVSSLRASSKDEQSEAALLRGQAFLEEGRNQEAVKEFNNALSSRPEWAEARYQLGFAQWKLGRLLEASGNLKRALALQPRHPLAAYYLGRIALLNSDLPKAIQYLEKTVEFSDGKPVLDEYFHLGKAYLASGKPNESIRILEKGIALQPRDDRLFAQLAKAYLSVRDKSKAERALAKSKELRDYQREATSLLLQCSEHLKARDVAKALDIYNRLSETDDVDDLVSLGIDFGQSELYQQAIHLLSGAVRLAPNSYEAHYNLGLLFLRTQRQDEAEEHFQRAAALRSYSFDTHSVLGVILSQKGKTEAAIKVLQRAAVLRPDDLKVTTLLALQLIEGRYYTLAAQTLGSAVKQWPGNIDLRFLFIEAYHRDRKYERAVEAALATVAQFPEVARANFEAGYQLISFGRLTDSRAFLEKAVQLDPDSAQAYASLGDLSGREGNQEQAIRYFEKALEKDSTQVDAYLGLGKSLLALGRYSDAVVQMERAVQLDPSNPQPHFHLAQAFQGMGNREKAAAEAAVFKKLNDQRMLERDQEGGREFSER
jgi:tetratricopeptide (TPR) repeat protein